MTPAELKRRREALGLTQAQLAERLGEHQPDIARWEGGRVRITRMRAAWLDQQLRALEAAAEQQGTGDRGQDGSA